MEILSEWDLSPLTYVMFLLLVTVTLTTRWRPVTVNYLTLITMDVGPQTIIHTVSEIIKINTLK